ncbi:MAG TPA: uroporphyrinogen decarboxylase family protein [Anaerolineaceae bacterium]|nr:uroporphyrinogen decarboxylase family protein [Anaerolineaceae bacterium]
MNHRQRLEACIAGKAIDRPPVALWRHFPVDDQDPKTLAGAILDFQSSFDFDFVKVTPASSFCVRDYGVLDAWRGNPEGTRDYLEYPIKNPAGWLDLFRLNTGEGHLGDQLTSLRMIMNEIDENTPVIQTIFNPMSQAKNLVGREQLLVHMRQNPRELLAGLEVLTDNTVRYVQECTKLGIEGIFFAIQHAQSSLLTEDEIDTFLLPFDNRIIEAASLLWLNVMHLHGKDIYFEKIPKSGFSVVNWHDQETPPTLQAGKSLFSGAVCGGLKQWETLVYGSPSNVSTEAQEAIQATGGERFILGTGCVLPIIAPRSNILAARTAVDG